MKLDDLTMDELPETTSDEPIAEPPKSRGRRAFVKPISSWQRASAERKEHPRPAWMSDTDLLPKKPPCRT